MTKHRPTHPEQRIPSGHQRHTLQLHGMERTFLTRFPENNARVPTVVMLHGAGGSAEFAIAETGWSTLAAEFGFAVIYPEGSPPRPDRKAKFLTNPQEWHDGSGRGQHDDSAFLLAILEALAPRIDPGRIYLTGFSNGAGMAFRFASENPGLLAALAPVAGHCWIEPPRIPVVPTLYMVGDRDPLVPIQGGTVFTPWRTTEYRPPLERTLNIWSRTIGLDPGSTDFQTWIIDRLGHHWPGGRGLLGEATGGPLRHDVDATRRIWDFFAERRRD